MAKIVMAVGKSLGPWFDPAKPEKQEPEYVEIHAGAGVGEFTVDQALVWDAAHQELEAQSSHTFNRSVLEALVRKQTRIKNPAKDVDHLLREGALVEVDLDDDSMEKFLRRYRLIPTAEGLGNFKDRRDLYALSRNGQVLMPISLSGRAVWSYSYLSGSMWVGCEELARRWSRQGQNIPVVKFAREIAEFLPPIVASGAGILEPV